MRRLPALLVILVLLLVPALAHAQYYISTSACTGCTGATTVNQLYDDGLHGDGAAGDGELGVDIVVDQPAGVYTWYEGSYSPGDSFITPVLPFCRWNSWRAANARLWTTGPGDVIHFRRRNGIEGGWAPAPAVSCDHGKPTDDTVLMVYLDSIKNVQGGTLYAANKSGTVWDRVVTVSAAGAHRYEFASSNGSVIFSGSYNARDCGTYAGEEYQLTFTTTEPNTDVRFQFDEATGMMRAVVLGVTPARTTSWGGLKILYR